MVDSFEAALKEAGELIQAIKNGLFDRGHLHAELGEIILGKKTGRSHPQQITIFKSVGVGAQDVMAAQLALRQADLRDLGQEIPF